MTLHEPVPPDKKKTRIATGTGSCNVMIMGLSSKNKKDRAAEVVARLRGISKPEALELVTKGNMVTVLSAVSRPDAENAVKAFKEVEVQAKIMEKKA